MEFVRKKGLKYHYFENLEIGDCFIDGEKVLIKINDLFDEDNCFNFIDNCLYTYEPSEQVEKIKCKLVEI